MNTIPDITNIIIKSLTNKEIVRLILSNKEQIQAIDFITLFNDRFGKFKQELNLSNLPLIIANNITDEEQKIAANKFIHFTRGFRIREVFETNDNRTYSTGGCFYELGEEIIEEGDDIEVPKDLGYIKLCSNVMSSAVVAIKNDGSVYTLGPNRYNHNSPSEKGFVDVACGENHIIGLKDDGSIVTWGSDTDNQIKNSPNDKGYISIVAGTNHSIALKNDGKIVLWGNDDCKHIRFNLPEDNKNTKIASGQFHGAALKKDGSISIWGSKCKTNYIVKTNVEPKSRFCPKDNNYINIACRYNNTIALKNDKSYIIFDEKKIIYQGKNFLGKNTQQELYMLLSFYQSYQLDWYTNLQKNWIDLTFEDNNSLIFLKDDGKIGFLTYNWQKNKFLDEFEEKGNEDQFYENYKCFTETNFVKIGPIGDYVLQYTNDDTSFRSNSNEEEDEKARSNLNEEKDEEEEEIPPYYSDYLGDY